MGIKEGSLARLAEVTAGDLVRVVAQDASRNVTTQNLANSLKPLLEALGFLTSDSVPSDFAQSRKVKYLLSSYNITQDDDTLIVNTQLENVGINLPKASDSYDSANQKGRRFTIKKADDSTNKIILNTLGIDLIDGQPTVELVGPAYVFVSVISDGSNWYLI